MRRRAVRGRGLCAAPVRCVHHPQRGEHGERAARLLPGHQDRQDPGAQVRSARACTVTVGGCCLAASPGGQAPAGAPVMHKTCMVLHAQEHGECPSKLLPGHQRLARSSHMGLPGPKQAETELIDEMCICARCSSGPTRLLAQGEAPFIAAARASFSEGSLPAARLSAIHRI